MRSELEMGAIAAKKALQRLVDDNPKSGVIVDRGELSEGKIRNKDAIRVIDRALEYFAHFGATNWGICGECTHYSQNGVSSVHNAFGNCTFYKSGKKLVHCYDTCPHHEGVKNV